MKNTTVAVLVECAFRAGFGALLAVPVATAVASTGIAHFPEGDRLLFEPGGLMLVEVMRALWSAVMPLVRGELVMGLGVVVALVLPHSLMLVACAGGAEESKRELWGRACARAPALLSLKGLTLLAQASIAFLTALASDRAPLALGGSDLTACRFDLALGVSLLGLVAVLAFGSAARFGERGFRTRGARRACRCHGSTDGVAGCSARRRAGQQRCPAAGRPRPRAGRRTALTGSLDVSRPGAWRVLCRCSWSTSSRCSALVLCRLSWLSQASSLVALQVDAASNARR